LKQGLGKKPVKHQVVDKGFLEMTMKVLASVSPGEDTVIL